MEIVRKIRDILLSLAIYDDIYFPMSNVYTTYCRVSEYKANRNKITLHFPVIHQYYNEGWCVNTDGIGKSLNVTRLSHFSGYPTDYPAELIKDADFPLSLEGGEYRDVENWIWEKYGFGTFKYEKFILSFAPARKRMKFYGIAVRVDDSEIKIGAERYLLPPYPVPLSICGEGKRSGEYTIDDLRKDVIAAMKEYKPKFASFRIEAGDDKLFEERRERLIGFVEEEMKKRDEQSKAKAKAKKEEEEKKRTIRRLRKKIKNASKSLDEAIKILENRKL